MDSLLRYAYIEQYCNACGGSYRVTLYEALIEHRVQREWESGRRCSHCAVEASSLFASVPAELIEDLDASWERVAGAAAGAGLDLKAGA